MSSKPRTDRAIQWLLDGDPAIRRQALRDLVGAAERTVERERRKVARDGWGARLLAKQDPKGTWAGGQSPDSGLYSPKWISTTYTMLLLRDFGLPANNRQARKACTLLVDGGLQPDGGINYGTWAKWIRRGETCVTGMVLSILSYFEYDDDRLDAIAHHLLEQQMPDGGWNCRRPNGATHASMHTTIKPNEAAMKTITLLLLLVLATSAPAQNSTSSQLQEMKKLDFLIGEWKGEGWTEFIPGQRRTSPITENAQPKLGGIILLIEGLGKTKIPGNDEEVVVHNGLAVISHIIRCKSKTISSKVVFGRWAKHGCRSRIRRGGISVAISNASRRRHKIYGQADGTR